MFSTNKITQSGKVKLQLGRGQYPGTHFVPYPNGTCPPLSAQSLTKSSPSSVEVNLAIISSSLPTLKPLVTKYLHRDRTQSYGSRRFPSNSNGSSELEAGRPAKALYNLARIKRTNASETVKSGSTEEFRFDPHHKTETTIEGQRQQGRKGSNGYAGLVGLGRSVTNKSTISVERTKGGGGLWGEGSSDAGRSGGFGEKGWMPSGTSGQSEHSFLGGGVSEVDIRMPEEAIMRSMEFKIVEERITI